MTQKSFQTKDILQNREFWRYHAQDLFFFETIILSEAWGDKYNDFGAIHKRMCHFLQSPESRKFLSAFRGSFKTTVLNGFAVHDFVHCVVRGIPSAMLYNTATKDNAFNFFYDFRHNILENPLLLWIYPELPRDEKAYDIFNKGRIQYNQVKMDFASTEVTLVSRHYPKWINDDLENDKNTRYETARDELKRSWKYQKAVLTKIRKQNIGLEIETGTPFHHDGLIWSIRNMASYDKLIIPYKENGKLTFPELYTEEDFEEKRESMGPKIFAAQYELNPYSEENALVKERWLKFWHILPKTKFRTMVIDPGGAEAGKSDPSGITIVDTDINGDLYVIYAEQLWLEPSELIKTIVDFKEEYDPDDIRIEKDKYAVTIADQFQHKFPYMNISYVEHKGRRKPDRIWRLRQWFNKGRVYIGQGQGDFIDQLLTYQGDGSIKYDDILDSFSYHLDIRRIPEEKKEDKYIIQKSFSEEMDKFLAQIEANKEGINYDKIY